MFRHIILFEFKDETTSTEIEKMFHKIGALQNVISGILNYSWGGNEWCNQSGMESPLYTHGFVMDFDSKASRDAYQVHEAHVSVVNEFVMPLITNATVLDYLCEKKGL